MRKRGRAAVLLSCLLGFSLSAGCAAGGDAGQNTAFWTTDLVSAEGARVSMTSGDAEADKEGILVQGEATYGGSFNAVFEGNTQISFGFCGGDSATYRRFTFIITFESVPAQSFSVVYESTVAAWTGEESARGRSGAYVQYGEELRTSRYWQSDKHATDADAWQSNDNFNVDEALASPMFGGAGEYEREFGELYGALYLEWTADGILQISVSDRFPEEYSPRLIAAFDGSDAGMGFDPVTGTWGLPRIDASAGYTISFRSEVFGGAVTQTDAPNVYFSEIVSGARGQEKTVSLAEEELETAPDFYVAKTDQTL